MQNKTEYEIKKLSELNRLQVEQAVAIFIDGFYYIYEKAVSKDKTLLKKLFIDAFDHDMVFVCLHEGRVVGFLGLGNSHKRCVALSKETCKRLFGKFKGAVLYMQIGGMLHEITVHEKNEGYIDYITTDDNYRGKGIATRLIKYACDTLSYESYTLDVLSKNTTAKRLYEHLGFVQTNIKKNPLIMLGGFGNQIVMKLDVAKVKKEN
ncbi:MAG: GNAT family N-acetyltransferase [Eubacteriales bacterium]|nr:GNAT family N-acetyltransferase [Eubacteriales bacterium]